METKAKPIAKAKDFLEEFKAFAIKGNVLDLAVGVVIGTAFNKIVDSLVKDIIMQAVAAVFGQPNFSDIAWNINGGSIRIGEFANNVINFFVVALSVFVAIKFINRFLPRRGEEANDATPAK